MSCKKIGILGGTFDPIHLGHLSLAQEVLEEKKLEKIVFLPAGIPNFKQEKEITLDEIRLEMLIEATKNNPFFEVDTRELFTEEVTYTYETLKNWLLEEDDLKFYFIIGEDSMLTLENWYKSEELKKITHFLVAKRSISFSFEKLEELKEKDYEIDFFETTFLDISSTKIREKVNKGHSIDYLVPKVIQEIVKRENLYEK